MRDRLRRLGRALLPWFLDWLTQEHAYKRLRRTRPGLAAEIAAVHKELTSSKSPNVEEETVRRLLANPTHAFVSVEFMQKAVKGYITHITTSPP